MSLQQTGSSLMENDTNEYVNYLETIIASMPGHVYWVNRNNIYLGCNDLQAQFLGLTSRKEIVGKTTFELLNNQQDAELIDANNRQVMESGLPHIIEEKVSNLEETYLSQKVAIKNDRGEVVGMLGVSLDITDRKRMERELKEAKEKAEMANDIKEEFIRNMEHDIRTPIAGIIGISKFLQTSEKDFEKRTFLQDIEGASQELINYFNEILEFSHLEAGMVPIFLKKFDLRELMRTVFQIELPAAKNKKIELIQHYPEDLPSIVLGDKYRLQRILINLVSNAIKFTETGYVKMWVDFEKKINDRNFVLKIVIEDTGVGISAEKQNVLYEKFNRGEPANKNIHKGCGLGLRIVKQFVNELEGEIEVKSGSGKGTKFICFLPFKLPL